VVLKEFIDNASDKCKNAGINPVIEIGMAATKNKMRNSVSHNGTDINKEVILNFNTRTSD
jgi:DNA topoisomerase VI subunit B